MPAEHVPVAAYVRRVEPLAHVGEGGMVQVTPAHGSPLHAPPEQPNGHIVSVGVYEQLPMLQVPVAEYVRRVVPLRHVAAGGMVHVTPAHGSPWHWPFMQPFAHVVSCGVYVHCPIASHEPGVM